MSAHTKPHPPRKYNWTEPPVLLRRARSRPLSVGETALLLGISRTSVERIEKRALRKLRERLLREGAV